MKIIALNFLVVIAIVITFSNKSQAGVNPKNGNFYVSYTDFVFKETHLKFDITRTYNSKIAAAGWFGIGWGSDFETFLYTIPGGGVCIHNNGSGKRDIQNPASWNLEDINSCVDELIEVLKTEGILKSPDEITNLRNKLINDMELRNTYWLKYLKKGKVKNIKIEQGTKLYSSCNCGGFSYLYVTENGFKRKNDSGVTEYFDNNGKLIKLEDDNGNWINFVFNDSLNIKSIEDNIGNKLFIKVNSNGQIIRIEDNNKRVASYKYDKKNLIYSCDIGANQYWFIYDASINMTSIKYADSSQMLMKYHKDTQFLTEIIDRDGTKTEYTYTDYGDKEYRTLILYKDKKDSLIKSEFCIWINRTKENGVTWSYKQIKITDSKDTLIKIFGEQLRMIDTIIHNRETTAYFYDIKGNFVKTIHSGNNKYEMLFTEKYLSKVITLEGTFSMNYTEDKKPLSVSLPDGKQVLFPFSADEKEVRGLISKCLEILDQAEFSDYIKIWFTKTK
jgi:hypothetical protein